MNLTIIKKSRALLLSMVLVGASAFTTSCGNGDSSVNLKIPGVNGPTVTLQQDNVLISMVFENVQLDGGLRYAIPKYKNSYMELSPDLQSSGTLFSISVSLTDVFDSNLQLLDPQSLPGGRALPGVATGRLPAVAFSIPKFHNISFYLGPKFFGLFMPVNLDIDQAIVTARFYTGKIRAGNLSLVGKDANGENSGFLLLLDLSSSVQKQLKKVMNQYN